MGNGSMTLAELSPATGGVPGSDPGCGHLANAVAAAWNSMAVEVHAAEGIWLTCDGPDSMYRSYARQQYWRMYWCGRGACQNAAVPGTSNHGLGWAIDNSLRALIAKHGAKYGFRWECSDAPWESWHLKWCGGWSGHDPGPYGSGGGGGVADPYPTLRKGDHGEAVKRLQDRLRVHNLGLTMPNPDGDFGEKTADAVREFQRTHNLKEDGVVGDNTWKKLRRRNVLTANEASHVNRLRYEERSDHPDADKVHNYRAWLAKRRDWMKNQPEKWWTTKRHARFVIIRREAGDA